MREKDNVDLICDIAELAGLFARSSSLDDFLGTATSIIAWHMKAAVCSIYLFDEEQQELVLRATQGLDATAVGHVRLKLGEGITGLALKELRPIVEGRGSTSPNFKPIPNIQEEHYEAFLAVPILRGLVRIGVLVTQDPEPDYFDENDVKALRAIAGQLATTIENANLLIRLHREEREGEAEAARTHPRFIKGKTVCEGIAVGRGSITAMIDEEALRAFDDDPTPRTLDDFQRAMQETENQLTALQSDLDEQLSDVASLIFSAHLLILKDREFSGDIEKQIVAGVPPQKAVSSIVHRYINLFAASPNPRLREKVLDLKDLGHRLLLNLMSHDSAQADYEGRIIIARELLPSELLKLAAQRAAGLVLLSGAATSHVAILARSLRLPTVLIDRQDLLQWVEDQNLLLDAIQGTLFIEPDAGVQASYQRLLEERQRIEQLEPQVEDETHSSDGVRVRLLANINLLSDLEPATRLKAEGIGLYRSEFPFIVRDNFPTEEEQYRIYQRLIDRMNGKPVTLRTLDIGGDKSLSYAPNQNEPNPFLGLRAIRYSLRNRPVFTQQLRAMLRAGVNQQLKIMFPLISSVDEFVQAKEIVHQCIAELAAEELPHNPHPQLGLMVELPSAVELIEELAQEADFLSIGTNDLIQYMLAVDRTNEQISDLYVPYHPAVLRALYRVAEAALRNDIEASICGDIAADPHMMVFLLGCGIRSFSVNARHIPYLQQHITRTNVEEARRNAMKVLRLSRIDEITASLGLPPPA
jgi:phosphotransferase system, enzyme I, PtsP